LIDHFAPRARDLNIIIGRFTPGTYNAITDVPGVRVGHTTLIQGDGPLVVGQGPVRTGVTVVYPHEGNIGADPVYAGSHVLNGNGEMTGLLWINESGFLATPIGITNTHSVGVVRDAMISYAVAQGSNIDTTWSLPVVAETYDGILSDINGMHVQSEHVWQALDNAITGPVAEGNVGGGTGMICHGFKGGIGTASRVLPERYGGWTVGVLVQANHGARHRLTVDGVPVGRELGVDAIPLPRFDIPAGAGSIIVIIATNAPLLPLQCRRLAQRAAIGIARTGGVGENSSGDLFLAFATGNRSLTTPAQGHVIEVRSLTNEAMTPLFEAVADATEEAIVNALCAATTMIGVAGRTAYKLPHDQLQSIMRAYHRDDRASSI
jgi:D-aminopeptidase